MRRSCDRCGKTYDARRPQSRFCSSACRVSAGRARKAGSPEALAPVEPVEAPMGGPLFDATMTELRRAGRDTAPAGVLALGYARRIDAGSETGSSHAALGREYRAAMSEALADAPKALDRLDELSERRRAKAGL